MFKAEGFGPVKDFEVDDFRGFGSLSVSSNYFTKQVDAPNETFRPFRKDEDPFAILNSYAASSREPLVRLPDNEVMYYERVDKKDKEGNM